MKEITKHFSRWKEFVCVIFGHDWLSYTSSRDDKTGKLLEESNECAYCGLEKHDRSGLLRAFKEKIGR